METKLPQTGEEQVRNYSQALSSQLQRTAERFASDIQETEELTRLESMATATPSQSISEVLKTLMSGLKASDLIMSKPMLADAFRTSMLQALPGVRYAAIIHRPKKPTKVIAYIGRQW